jgi:hypothetical protein
MLNIMTNSIELLGIFGGSGLLAWSFLGLPGMKMSRTKATAFAVVMIISGLACPGLVNWMVASARDANLFS